MAGDGVRLTPGEAASWSELASIRSKILARQVIRQGQQGGAALRFVHPQSRFRALWGAFANRIPDACRGYGDAALGESWRSPIWQPANGGITVGRRRQTAEEVLRHSLWFRSEVAELVSHASL